MYTHVCSSGESITNYVAVRWVVGQPDLIIQRRWW